MRPHVCIPSGCQQWTPRSIAVGIDKFAYMSSLAIYVYSSYTFQPLAILAKHQQHLSALAMSPFDRNQLACIIGNQEIRVYDVDSESPVCKTFYTGTKAKASILEWHRTQPGVLLMAIGSHLVAWDFTAALESLAAGGGPGAAAAASGTTPGSMAAPPPPPSSPPPPSQAPRSVLMRLRGHARGGGGAGSGAVADAPMSPVAGRWTVLRDFGSHVTAFDQCAPVSGGSSGGAGTTVVAVANSDGRVVLLELEPSGFAVRCELRSITLPDAAASGGGGLLAAPAPAGPAVGAASAVCWEPLSGNGLLLAVGRGGAMALYDTATGEAVLSYTKQPATAVRFAAFLSRQPGNFLLSSSRSGALQLWNVSQPHPLRLFKLGGGLVQGFALLPSPPTSLAAAATPPARTAVLVSFSDGALCVYDLDSQQVLWRQEGGHTETVFDCRFCTTDPNLLATASYDSTVRVWDVRLARCLHHLVGGEGILYSVSWSADGRMLAASNDSGVIFLYDYGRGMMVKALRQHTKQSLRVAFHPVKPNLLASASVDGSVFVFTTDGETVRTLRHVSAVSCIAWGPAHLAPNLLATTCEEGELHVWDIGKPPQECLVRTLSRHSSRTFNVEFSPLLRNLLLSSSNDHTARVWDISTGSCLAVLQGHTAQVRAVAWHPEVAHICFTGSWDAAVRVWDIRTGRCLHVATDHVADVYGIACHPQRPFFMVTCSRDTTLRLWSTLDLTPNLMPQALVRSLQQLRLPAEEALGLSQGAPAALSGEASRELAERLAAPACTPLERFAAITELFLPPACVDVFWGLASCVKAAANAAEGPNNTPFAAAGVGGGGEHLGLLPSRSHPDGGAAAAGSAAGGSSDNWYSLHHWASARLAVGSAANHLELAAYSKTRGGAAAAVLAASGGSCAAASRRQELLRSAAQQHLVAGNVEHCCELLAELGDWDRALALAPVVGLELWQRLMRQRVQALAEAETQSHVSDVLPLYLVSGQVPALVDMLSSAGMHDMAFNVAAVQASGGYKGFNVLAGPVVTATDAACERCPSAGGSDNGDAERQAPSSGAPAAPVAGLEHLRTVFSSDLTASSTAPRPGNGIPPNGSASGGGGSSPSPAALPPLSPSSAASSNAAVPLPPVTQRGGTLPSLVRAPSLRPPPLTPITTSNTGAPPSSPLPLNGRSETWAPAPSAFTSTASGNPWDGPASPPPPPLPLAATSPLPALSPSRSAPSPHGFPPPSAAPDAAAPAAAAPAATSASDRIAYERAVAVRCAQACSFLSQGLPLPAACCALSVDDLPGAVGLLLRGGMEEVALALVLGLSRPVAGSGIGAVGGAGGRTTVPPSVLGYGLGISGCSSSGFSGGNAGGGGARPGGYGSAAALEATALALRPRVLAAVSQRREASGDFLTAAELMRQVPGSSDLKELLAGRCRARCDSPTIVASVYHTLGLQEPFAYKAPGPQQGSGQDYSSEGGGGGGGGADWEAVRLLLLAGQQAAAAERLLAGVTRLVEAGERVTLTSPEWELAWVALNSLSAASLDAVTWGRVFALAAYVGALLALEQGCAAVGLYLVRVLEAWVASRADVEAPVSQARLAAEVCEALDACLALPAYRDWAVAREVMGELAAAPKGSQWLQGVIQSRLAAAEPSLLPPSALASPTSPVARGGGIRSPTHRPATAHGGSGGGGGTNPDGALASPSSSLARRLASCTAAAGGGAAAVSSSLRLGAQEYGSGSGRLATGGALAASLAASLSQVAGTTAAAVGVRSSDSGCGASAVCLADLACGPVVVAAANVPSRPSSSSPAAPGALPTSVVSGGVIRGAAVLLDDGRTRLSLHEAVALRRVLSYSPLGTGKLLCVP